MHYHDKGKETAGLVILIMAIITLITAMWVFSSHAPWVFILVPFLYLLKFLIYAMSDYLEEKKNRPMQPSEKLEYNVVKTVYVSIEAVTMGPMVVGLVLVILIFLLVFIMYLGQIGLLMLNAAAELFTMETLKVLLVFLVPTGILYLIFYVLPKTLMRILPQLYQRLKKVEK
jgi:hypothetical protein